MDCFKRSSRIYCRKSYGFFRNYPENLHELLQIFLHDFFQSFLQKFFPRNFSKHSFREFSMDILSNLSKDFQQSHRGFFQKTSQKFPRFVQINQTSFINFLKDFIRIYSEVLFKNSFYFFSGQSFRKHSKTPLRIQTILSKVRHQRFICIMQIFEYTRILHFKCNTDILVGGIIIWDTGFKNESNKFFK